MLAMEQKPNHQQAYCLLFDQILKIFVNLSQVRLPNTYAIDGVTNAVKSYE